MAKQLDINGGEEELTEPTPPKPKFLIHFKEFSKDANAYALTMADEGQRRASVESLFPEYTWHEDESVLWNYIHAHAERYNVDHNIAKSVIADASDPIFGGERIAKYTWYLA